MTTPRKSMKDRLEQFSKEKETATSKKAPDPVTDLGETVLMATRVPKAWPKALRIYALQNDTTVQALLNEWIKREMGKLGIM